MFFLRVTLCTWPYVRNTAPSLGGLDLPCATARISRHNIAASLGSHTRKHRRSNCTRSASSVVSNTSFGQTTTSSPHRTDEWTRSFAADVTRAPSGRMRSTRHQKRSLQSHSTFTHVPSIACCCYRHRDRLSAYARLSSPKACSEGVGCVHGGLNHAVGSMLIVGSACRGL